MERNRLKTMFNPGTGMTERQVPMASIVVEEMDPKWARLCDGIGELTAS